MPPGGEQLDDQIPPPLQQGTDKPDGTQRKDILQADAQNRAVGVFRREQIPRNSGKLYGMYAEDVQGAAANGLKKAYQRVPVPVQPQNSRTNSRPARPSSRMLMGPKVHSAMDTQSVMPVAKAAAGISRTAAHRMQDIRRDKG